MPITFAISQPRCGGFEDFLHYWIERKGSIRIADLGGGANPMLSLEFVRRHHLQYSVIDLSAVELDKAPSQFQKIQADLSAPTFAWEKNRRFDLVFSRMLAEHVPNGRQFHQNVRSLLVDGGVAVHCFPTLYSLPFVLNRLLNRLAAERFADWLLRRIQPRDRYQYAKFPAYYSWCRGPSPRQCGRFTALGYEILEYRGFFGHPYFEAIPPFHRLQQQHAERRLRHPNPAFTSYAFLALQRCDPGGAADAD